jgi:hypothetical protein
MRVASRIVGALLALAGLAFLALFVFVVTLGFDRGSVLIEASHRTTWIAGSFATALSIAFLLAGRYYFMLDVEKPDEEPVRSPWRFAPYVQAYRHQLKTIALVGLVISLVRLAAACFEVDWPGAWVTWPLLLAAFGLGTIAGRSSIPDAMNRFDWKAVPKRIPAALNLALQGGEAVFVILALLSVWNAWSHHLVSPPPAILTGLVALLFGWEAVFFSYGKIHIDNAPGNARKR